jgi:hypothetical protein
MTIEDLEEKQYDAKCAIAEIALDCEAKTYALQEIRSLCESADCDNWQSIIERIKEVIWLNR